VYTLLLYRDAVLGDQHLQNGLVALVSGEERLVREQTDHVSQMRVEVAHEMGGVGDVNMVTTEQPAKDLGHDRLSDALAAAKHDGDLSWARRRLNRARHPLDQIIVESLVSSAHVVANVVQVERA